MTGTFFSSKVTYTLTFFFKIFINQLNQLQDKKPVISTGACLWEGPVATHASSGPVLLPNEFWLKICNKFWVLVVFRMVDKGLYICAWRLLAFNILILERDCKLNHLYSEDIIKISSWENLCSSVTFKFLFP